MNKYNWQFKWITNLYTENGCHLVRHIHKELCLFDHNYSPPKW